MFGLVHGVKHGQVHGPKHNGASLYAGLPWTVDPVSNIATPVSSAEWSAFISAKGLSISAPNSVWGFQESSGNALDAIGGITLTAAGTVAYNQAASGWARTGVGLSDGVNSTFSSASASLPNASAASQTVLLIGAVTTSPAGNRQIYVGPSNTLRLMGGTAKFSVTAAANTTTGTASPLTSVRPWVYKHDFTGSVQKGYTDQETGTPTFAAIAGKALRLGSTSASAGGVFIYGCAWYGAPAEISDANLKALLQAMGFTILW